MKHTKALRLLRHYGVSVSGIARSFEAPQPTICRALSKEHSGSTSRFTVLAVRQRVEAVLQAMGWDGDPAELWAEYDDEPAADRQAA